MAKNSIYTVSVEPNIARECFELAIDVDTW